MIKIEIALLIGWIAGFWLGSYIQYKLNKKLRQQMFKDWDKTIKSIIKGAK